MLWLYLDIAVAVIFRDIQRGLYLGRRQEEIIMTPYPEEALDLSIQDTEPKSISSLLSLGTKALAVEQNTSKIHIDDIEFKSRNQFFRIILVSSGSYVFSTMTCVLGIQVTSLIGWLMRPTIHHIFLLKWLSAQIFKTQFISLNRRRLMVKLKVEK